MIFLLGKKPTFSYQAIRLEECIKHNILDEIKKISPWLDQNWVLTFDVTMVTKVFQKTKVQQVKTPLPSCTICWVRNIIDTLTRIFFGDILGQRFVDFHNGIKCHKHPKCSKLNLKEPLNLIRINLCVHVPNEMTTTHSSTTAIWHIKSPYLSRSL